MVNGRLIEIGFWRKSRFRRDQREITSITTPTPIKTGRKSKKLNKFAESTLWGEYNGNLELLSLKLREFSPTAQKNKTFWLRVHYIHQFVVCSILEKLLFMKIQGFTWRNFFYNPRIFAFGEFLLAIFELLHVIFNVKFSFFRQFKGYDLSRCNSNSISIIFLIWDKLCGKFWKIVKRNDFCQKNSVFCNMGRKFAFGEFLFAILKTLGFTWRSFFLVFL